MMLTRVILVSLFVLLSFQSLLAQNTNSSSTTPARPRTTNTNQQTKPPAPPAKSAEKPATSAPAPKTAPKKPVVSSPPPPGGDGVLAAFNSLLDGIRHADVDMVADAYWKSPRLALFNFNGTVTKGWEQMRENRKSSYPEIKDVKLDVRDVALTMLGRDAAAVTCQWTQSQTYKGTPETASGRMTLIFKRIGTAWKAIHLHSSPDSPNPASIPPSEQAPKPSPTPIP
jgi:ketosteroid isomerase-like protein